MEIRRVKILDEFKEHGVKKKSKLFILPMLCDNVRFGEFSQYFVDINISIEKMYIYVLLDNTYTDEGLRNLVYKLENHYSWISSDYVDDNEVLMLSFNVIKEYSQDYKKFIDGKYSDESNQYILESGLYTRFDHKSYILYENDIDNLCIRLFR